VAPALRRVDHGSRPTEATHYSPLTGQDDVPESYHAVRHDLSAEDDG
jgi:hypothetical protein